MIRTWPPQQAIYGAIAGDANLVSLVTGIADEPLQNQVHPFIVLGEDTGTPDDLLIETGAQVTLTLHVWDKDAPTSRTKQIIDRMIAVLHNTNLVLSAGTAVACLCEFTNTTRDGDTIHGILRVRVISFG